MSKKETTSDGFTLEQLLDFKTVAELKDIAMLFGFSYRSGAKKANIVSHLAKLLIDEPMRLIKACYLYELEMFKDIIQGNMSVEYAEKSGILFDFNRFGLVYSLVDKKTKEKSLHFPKELGEILLPLIESEIGHRKTIGGDIVEKAVIGWTNIYGYTDLYNVFNILEKLEKRFDLKLEDEETFTDIVSPFYHVTMTKKDNTNPILSPFAAMVGFYPDIDHLTNNEPKEYDLDTLISFGEMPYPQIDIKEADTLEMLLQKYGDPKVGTPREILRQIWLDKQDQSKWEQSPVFGQYFLFTDERKINECLSAQVEFLNNVPCWRFNGNSSHDIFRKETEDGHYSGKMPQIKMGPNMRAMGIESFEQLLEMAQRGEELPPFPELSAQSSSKSKSKPSKPSSTKPQSKPSSSFTNTTIESPTLTTAASKKVGRNEPCPCGSGKKFKNCCGR